MFTHPFFTVFLSLILILVISFAQAALPANMTVKDIADCMRVNVFERGAIRDFQIRAYDREGKSSKLKFKAFWKPSKNKQEIRLTLQVLEPKSLRGTAYLATRKPQQDKLYLYLPELKRVRIINGGETSQKLWGSDFTIADIEQIQGLLVNGKSQRLTDQTLEDRPVYVIETLTNGSQNTYTKVVSYIDQQSCLIFKAELFSGSTQPQKVLTADASTLLDIDPWWLVQGYRMKDLQNGTRTDLWLSNIYIQERLPESLFTPQGFFVEQE